MLSILKLLSEQSQDLDVDINQTFLIDEQRQYKVYISPSTQEATYQSILLFAAVQEMISIMQDYGEVVCCVGSSFNSVNPAIFIQADIR